MRKGVGVLLSKEVVGKEDRLGISDEKNLQPRVPRVVFFVMNTLIPLMCS